MALIIRHNVDAETVEDWGRVRERKIAGITTKTDQGTVATSPVSLPDPDGTHVIRGLRRTYMSESDSPVDFNVIYDGYLGPRDIGRDAEHILGASRAIGVTLVDHNTLLTNYLIQGANDAAHGVRPEETDLERIAWLLASAFTHPINDFGAIATTGGVLMDASDLRGQNAGNVFRDAGLISGRQHFLYYDESQATENRIGLFYNKSDEPVWSSTLRFSNHPGDADDIRTAWGNMAALTFDFDSASPPVQHIKPDQIASDVLIDYDGGKLFVTCEEVGLTTRDDYYVKQLTIPAPNVKTAAGALRLATQQLRDHRREASTASVQILLPSTHVGLIQPGHRAEFRFDHFEAAYRDFVWWRVQQHTWAQKGRKWYVVNLELEPVPSVEVYCTEGACQRFDTGYNVTIPDCVADGDVLVAIFSGRTDSTGQSVGPDAWTQAAAVNAYNATQYPGPGPNTRVVVWYRTWSTGDSPNVQISGPGAGSQTQVIVLKGVSGAPTVSSGTLDTDVNDNISIGPTAGGGTLVGVFGFQRNDAWQQNDGFAVIPTGDTETVSPAGASHEEICGVTWSPRRWIGMVEGAGALTLTGTMADPGNQETLWATSWVGLYWT